jgi:DNA-binding response OmpR family regulator
MRVLVVEDERRLASAVRRGLTAEGFVVDVAHDGVDGLHLAREGGYDAVVLDLMLPGLSGYQVCQRLRAARNWVPVLILLTAGDLSLDPAARTACRGEADIHLTTREFALLEYLMRRAGQVVPKTELACVRWSGCPGPASAPGRLGHAARAEALGGRAVRLGVAPGDGHPRSAQG